ncbi:hypothetical protein KQX54_011549 [Cotesia glomerata]|uniref:Uncharacterized protein n=1 Tax=Cotesia glomerata TaxID=32391 RepID=A0AAV7I5H2_COTGL|nr:hypothetical protein KQX54_011549 [Cotesia glomerata]
MKTLSPIFHLDFELASRNAIKRFMPSATTQPCYFRWYQAINKNARKKGATKRRKKNVTVTSMDLKIEEILKFIRALAYLPAEEIPVALIKIIRREEDENIFKRMRRFFKYFIDQWLVKRKPEECPLFPLTLFLFSILHIHVSKPLFDPSSTFPSKLQALNSALPLKLLETQNAAYRDYLAIQSMKSIQRGQIENREKLAKISDLNQQLILKQITPMRFLELATNFTVDNEGILTPSIHDVAEHLAHGYVERLTQLFGRYIAEPLAQHVAEDLADNPAICVAKHLVKKLV